MIVEVGLGKEADIELTDEQKATLLRAAKEALNEGHQINPAFLCGYPVGVTRTFCFVGALAWMEGVRPANEDGMLSWRPSISAAAKALGIHFLQAEDLCQALDSWEDAQLLLGDAALELKGVFHV